MLTLTKLIYSWWNQVAENDDNIQGFSSLPMESLNIIFTFLESEVLYLFSITSNSCFRLIQQHLKQQFSYIDGVREGLKRVASISELRFLRRIIFQVGSITSSRRISVETKVCRISYHDPSDLLYLRAHNNIEHHNIRLKEKIITLSAGEFHYAFSTGSGKLYTGGYGRFGQLGNCIYAQRSSFPSRMNVHRLANKETFERFAQTEPKPVELVPCRVLKVVCGNLYNLALTFDGDIYSFGKNENGCLGHFKLHDPFWGCVYRPGKVHKNDNTVFVDIESNSVQSYFTDEELNVWSPGKVSKWKFNGEHRYMEMRVIFNKLS
eukprot:maker-scaffold_15-snap-gene-6.46-mRNA-1 protein AED:0.01 eAED:0.04 QI:8/1/0.75/1/1/1/4/237/320